MSCFFCFSGCDKKIKKNEKIESEPVETADNAVVSKREDATGKVNEVKNNQSFHLKPTLLKSPLIFISTLIIINYHKFYPIQTVSGTFDVILYFNFLS